MKAHEAMAALDEQRRKWLDERRQAGKCADCGAWDAGATAALTILSPVIRKQADLLEAKQKHDNRRE